MKQLFARTIGISLLSVFAVSYAGHAQQSRQPTPCTAMEHRQFDFWIGEWIVFNQQGPDCRNVKGSRHAIGGRPAQNAARYRARPITWTPQNDGAVEQRWDISTDGGATWTTGFVGMYRRKR